jgi:hypothetical protein
LRCSVAAGMLGLVLRRPRLARLAFWALTALGSGSSVALAGPPSGGVEFAWDAPSEVCPSEALVVAELERLLGGPVSEQGDRRLSAIARVRREADGSWDLRLWTITADATRQRSMVGEDCAVLAEAAALLAAMAIDPTVLERMGASEAAVEQAEQAEELAAEPEPEPEPDPEPEPEPLPEPSEPNMRIGLRAQGGISYGDLPGVGPIVRLALALQWKRARFELEGHYGFARHAPLGDGSDRGGKLQMAFAIARGCAVVRHRPSKLEFPLCAGLEGGAALGEGVGLDQVRKGSVPWLALDIAPSLVWAPTRRVAIGVTVEPWVAILRRRFEVDNVGVIWRPQPAGVRASAGIEVRF